MLFLSVCRKSALLIFGMACVAGQMRAQEILVSGEDIPAPLQVRLQNEAIIASEQIRRVYVKTGTNEFALIVPRDFRLNAGDSRELVFEETRSRCFITVRVVERSSGSLQESDCRNRLNHQYPNAELLDQFSRTTGEGAGLAFDLQQSNSLHTIERLRIVLLPSTTGYLEFTLHSKPDSFEADKDCFDWLLWSYKTDRSGKITPIQAPAQPPAS